MGVNRERLPPHNQVAIRRVVGRIGRGTCFKTGGIINLILISRRFLPAIIMIGTLCVNFDSKFCLAVWNFFLRLPTSRNLTALISSTFIGEESLTALMPLRSSAKQNARPRCFLPEEFSLTAFESATTARLPPYLHPGSTVSRDDFPLTALLEYSSNVPIPIFCSNWNTLL